jgi:hypothetical protein
MRRGVNGEANQGESMPAIAQFRIDLIDLSFFIFICSLMAGIAHNPGVSVLVLSHRSFVSLVALSIVVALDENWNTLKTDTVVIE